MQKRASILTILGRIETRIGENREQLFYPLYSIIPSGSSAITSTEGSFVSLQWISKF